MNTVVQAIALTGLVSCTQDTSVVGQKANGPVDAGDTGDGPLDEDADDTGQEGDLSTPCAADAGALPRGEEGTFLSQDATVSATRPACTAPLHATAGAGGSTLRVQLDASDDGGLWLLATDLTADALTPTTWLAPGEGLDIPLARSGELLLEFQPEAPGHVDDPPAAYTLTVTCVDACERPYTRHPVVFMHGMGGTDAYLDTLDYWYGVEDAYTEAGLTGAWPAVDALASIASRAEQWADIVDLLAAQGVGRRFNLVAHSQGGLDARLLIHAHDPDHRVASLTTISAPHGGTPIADLTDGVLDLTPFDSWLVDAVVASMAGLVGLNGPELSEQVSDLTTASMATFNEAVPDRADVAYWSWAGASCRGLDWVCQYDRDGEIIDPVFSASFRLIDFIEGDNDGVVSVSSARWGTFLGELPADHMDEVGQIADRNHPAFDAQDFYLDEARRLAAAGL